jgi:hypothetical protein
VAHSDQTCLLPPAVPGDGQPVALLALAVLDPAGLSGLGPSPHGVLGGVVMPLVALGPIGLVVRPVLDLVEVVLGVSPIDEILGSVVLSMVSVDVPRDQPFGASSLEHASDEDVDLEVLRLPVISVEHDLGVTLLGEGWTEDLPGASRSSDRVDVAPRVDEVVTEASYVYPLAIWEIIHAPDSNPTTARDVCSSGVVS